MWQTAKCVFLTVTTSDHHEDCHAFPSCNPHFRIIVLTAYLQLGKYLGETGCLKCTSWTQQTTVFSAVVTDLVQLDLGRWLELKTFIIENEPSLKPLEMVHWLNEILRKEYIFIFLFFSAFRIFFFSLSPLWNHWFWWAVVIVSQMSGSHLNCFLCGINEHYDTNVLLGTSVRILNWVHNIS